MTLITVSDEQAKAIQEVVKALRGVGSFFEKALGSVPEDLVGMLGGDWLKIRRAENIAAMMQRAKRRLEARGKEPEPASLSIALPILRAAADESREQLQEIWARLLANAMDTDRTNRVREAFTEAAKRLEPLDALVLTNVRKHATSIDGHLSNVLANELRVEGDEIDVSVHNLLKLEMLTPLDIGRTASAMSAFGREFLRAIE